MSKLYVIGTPIGNLKDITLRALEVLKGVDVVLCEDTRVTKKLLSRYEIRAKTLSFHSHSAPSKIENIIQRLRDGKDLALVSDAGTPTISDPGSVLISSIRKTLPDVSIIAIPGASALTSALSVSGLPSSDFLFLGFLPHKKGRESLFKEIADSSRTVVFYESSHRIMKALRRLAETLSGKRKVVVARELTKVFEEVVSGSAEDVLRHFTEYADKQRGEFVVMVSGD